MIDSFLHNIVKGVNKVINNKELREKMEINGRKRVEEYFDWISIAKQVEELYKSVKN